MTKDRQERMHPVGVWRVLTGAAVLVALASCFAIPIKRSGAGPAASRDPCSDTHRQFGMEDESAQCPTTIPDDVAAILLKDDRVRETLGYEDLPANKLPASWVMASEVHLAKRSEKDLVVMGRGMLLGANVTAFWVFKSVDGAHQLVLRGTASDLEIVKERWNGHSNINLVKVAQGVIYTTTFRFDGKRYQEFRQSEKEVRPGS